MLLGVVINHRLGASGIAGAIVGDASWVVGINAVIWATRISRAMDLAVGIGVVVGAGAKRVAGAMEYARRIGRVAIVLAKVGLKRSAEVGVLLRNFAVTDT